MSYVTKYNAQYNSVRFLSVIVFQFYNNANQDAELFSFAHIPGSTWSEEDDVEVAGNGGFLQRQVSYY